MTHATLRFGWLRAEDRAASLACAGSALDRKRRTNIGKTPQRTNNERNRRNLLEKSEKKEGRNKLRKKTISSQTLLQHLNNSVHERSTFINPG